MIKFKKFKKIKYKKQIEILIFVAVILSLINLAWNYSQDKTDKLTSDSIALIYGNLDRQNEKINLQW